MDGAAYLQLGKELIPAVLERELACFTLELAARISDAKFGTAEYFVEPHHLSRARIELESAGVIEQTVERTRGGRDVHLWTLTGKRTKAVDRAAARKRLVAARYLGWAQGSPSRPGLTGPAAEQVVHASLVAAAPYGLTLAHPEGPGVSTFLGVQVPHGPLDSAAFRIVMRDGVPAGQVALPIEVKNLRDWIYPQSRGLYQLLDKAAHLQNAHPRLDMAPILVCRRAHFTTMRMAKTLGFYVIMTRRQYISTSVEQEKVLEVRRELGFLDLVPQATADDVITRSLIDILPKVLERTAYQWKQTAEVFGDVFCAARHEDDGELRTEVVRTLREYARELEDEFSLGW